MRKLLALLVSLLAVSSASFSRSGKVIHMDCLEPLSEYDAPSEYLRKLFIGEHRYEFSCIVMPSFTSEYSLGYEKTSRSLVYCYAETNVYYNDGRDNPVTTVSVRIPEETGDSLSVLFSLATESSKYYDERIKEGIEVMDGTEYVFSHSNGITATCHSPEAGNAYRLVNLVYVICNLVRDNDVQGIIGLQDDISSLIDDFRKVVTGTTSCSRENGTCVPFPESVERVRRSYDDRALVDAVAGSDVCSRTFSSSEDYALISCYVLYCRSKDASAEIGERLVGMLDKFPWKWQEMETCWESLKKSQQKKLWRYFAGIILTEYSKTGNGSKTEFYYKYPYLLDIRMPFQWK